MITTAKRQQGASIITAIFLITALAALAAAMTRMTVHSAIVTTDDYLAQQALYAAESGVDWAAYDLILGNPGTTTDTVITTNSWFTTTVNSWTIDAGSANQRIYYEISSVGEAGGTAATPRVQRLVTVYFMP